MKIAIIVLAFVAAASAQFNQYNPGQYNAGQYNAGQYSAGKYNPFNPYQKNPYNRYSTPAPYRPYVTSTFAPPVYSTPAPIYSTPAPYSTIAPVYSTPSPLLVAKVNNLDARNANIVKYGNEINPDGSYSYFYETDNGIAAQEQGVPRNLGGNPPAIPDVAQGSFSYTSPEGIPVVITYVADENGFQPQGNVIPTSPPVPAQIARALAYIAKYSPVPVKK